MPATANHSSGGSDNNQVVLIQRVGIRYTLFVFIYLILEGNNLTTFVASRLRSCTSGPFRKGVNSKRKEFAPNKLL